MAGFGGGLWKLFGGIGKEPEKKNRLAILVDYENISRELSIDQKALDIDKVIQECLEIGIIDFAFLFVPSHMVSFRLPGQRNMYRKGFCVIACPSAYDEGIKDKDKVDTIMSEIGLKLVENSSITHVVIISHDGDFTRLVNRARFHGKKIVVIAGKNLSFLLKDLADILYPLPLKEKNGSGL